MATQQRSSLFVWRCAVVLALAMGASAARAADVTHLLIVGTNDIHGALAPRRQNDGSFQGGLALLTGYVDILRRENRGRVIWLDAGDEFQGSIESNLAEGATVVRALNRAGVTAAAIGNHEFDFGPVGRDDTGSDPLGALQARIREARYPFLAANVVRVSTGSSPFPRGAGSTLQTVAGIRVGIIGLATTRTGVTTWPPFVRDLRFSDLKTATLREAEHLRQDGAEIVLLVAHVGIRCAAPAASEEGPCSGELVDLLDSLPSGTVDAVVSGHSHTLVNARVNGVPVVQAGGKGEYLNVIDLPFDRRLRRVVRDGNRIEGPIPVRAAALFHGRRVRANRALERMLRPVFANAAPLRDKVLATADGPIKGREDRENGMGDLITDALLANTGADFALINAGGIRSAFGAGPITYGAVFETLPFENKVAVVRVSGRDLQRILRVAESGATGYFPVAGLRLTISTCKSCPGDDLDGDGRIDRWENNRLLVIERSDGSPVRDDDEYTLATLDFVIQGGDHMGWPFSQIPPERIRYTSVLARDALVQLLEQRQHIKSDSGSLAPGARPRLIFVEGGEAAGKTER